MKKIKTRVKFKLGFFESVLCTVYKKDQSIFPQFSLPLGEMVIKMSSLRSKPEPHVRQRSRLRSVVIFGLILAMFLTSQSYSFDAIVHPEELLGVE